MAPIYETYDQVPVETQVKDHCVAIMMNRWDGRIGFPGGNVDEGDESLAHAAARELREELNYLARPEDLVPLRSDVINEFITVHAFHLNLGKVPFKVIKRILSEGMKSEHVVAEGTPFAAHLENYRNGKGEINNGLRNGGYARIGLVKLPTWRSQDQIRHSNEEAISSGKGYYKPAASGALHAAYLASSKVVSREALSV